MLHNMALLPPACCWPNIFKSKENSKIQKNNIFYCMNITTPYKMLTFSDLHKLFGFSVLHLLAFSFGFVSNDQHWVLDLVTTGVNRISFTCSCCPLTHTIHVHRLGVNRGAALPHSCHHVWNRCASLRLKMTTTASLHQCSCIPSSHTNLCLCICVCTFLFSTVSLSAPPQPPWRTSRETKTEKRRHSERGWRPANVIQQLSTFISCSCLLCSGGRWRRLLAKMEVSWRNVDCCALDRVLLCDSPS